LGLFVQSLTFDGLRPYYPIAGFRLQELKRKDLLLASYTFCAFCEKITLMKRRDFLAKWGLSSLKIKAGFVEGEFAPNDPDREAAWELYVELLTRVTTQSLPLETGNELAALDSVYAIFPVTREILRRRGSGSGEFAKLAIPVLNQIIRPFTTKWHRLSLAGAFGSETRCQEFREGLAGLQPFLLAYTRALADMAGVEDLTGLEAAE
jgi:hypothetical protein